MHVELEHGSAPGSGREVRYLMEERTSIGARAALGSSVLLFLFVVYAQTHLDEMVSFVQWVTASVIEDELGITKEMLENF